MALKANVPLESLLFNDDNVETKTSAEQTDVEAKIFKIYNELTGNPAQWQVHQSQHKFFLRNGLFTQLSEGFTSLNASLPWICYWTTHGLDLLGDSMLPEEQAQLISFLSKCQSSEGGFGGGPGQVPHLAPTYASISALVSLGTDEALKIINRKKLYEWLMKLKQPNGAFVMHLDGEVDLRAAYCAMVVASICNILTPELKDKVGEYVASCQTYEGGIGAVPMAEAHGGYAFCGVAALKILNQLDKLNLNKLFRWAVSRQMRFEGGFQGRTNKLVDSCYSFWQGGIFPILGAHYKLDAPFDKDALQDYVLLCCQFPGGGCKDKPGKSKDYYHTCYALSGLSLAQHTLKEVVEDGFTVFESTGASNLRGNSTPLRPTDPVYNICPDHLKSAFVYFRNLPSIF